MLGLIKGEKGSLGFVLGWEKGKKVWKKGKQDRCVLS